MRLCRVIGQFTGQQDVGRLWWAGTREEEENNGV